MSTVSVIYDLIGRDSASPAFRKAGESASAFDRTMSRIGKTVAVASAAIGTAAVAIATESIKAAVSFQAAMEKIHTQAGASQKDVEALTASVLKLAPSTQQGPEQLAEALFHLKSVGMSNVMAMKALKTASDLAATGQANLEDTTNALAGAWRSGIKGAQSFGETAATVNAIIGAGNMRMEDLTAAMSTGILPSARAFGVSLKSVGAALALMTDEGIPAEMAATRLRMSLSLLGAPSKAAEKELESIGLTGLDLANAMRGPQGIIGAISLLKQHLDASGLSASQEAILLSHAFGGGRSSSGILTLLNNLSVLEKKQKQINDTTGQYGAAVAAQRQTAQAQFALLRSSIDTLGIRLGLDLLPPVTTFVGYLAKTAVPAVSGFAAKIMSLIPVKTIKRDINDAIKWVDNFLGLGPVKAIHVQVKPVLPGNNAAQIFNAPVKVPAKFSFSDRRQIFNTPVEVPLRLGPVIAPPGGITQALIHAPKKVPVIDQLPALLSQAFAKVDWGKVLANVIQGAVSGAQAIGAAFLTILGKINWIQFGQQFAVVAVGLAVGLVNNLVPALISEAIHHPMDMLSFLLAIFPVGKAAGVILKIFGKVPFLGPLLKFFLEPLSKVGDKMGSLLGKILKKVFGPVGDLIGRFFQGAAKWLFTKGDDVVLGLLQGIESRWPKLANWLAGISGRFLRFFLTAAVWLLKKGADIIGGLLDGLTSWWTGHAWPWLGKIGGWILSRFTKAGSWLVSKGSSVVSGLLDGMTSWWTGKAWPWLGRIGGWIGSRFSKAASWLYNGGKNIIGGLLRGITDAFKGIGTWIKAHIVDPVVNWVKHWFGIKSPSTVMAWIGSHLMGGLFKGMLSHDVSGMVEKIFGSLPGALGALVGKGLVTLAELPAKALSALGGLASKGWHWLFGGGGGGSPQGSNQALGKSMAAWMDWTGAQWDALQMLWQRESGWDATARNPVSGAYGIPQALPASKMASAGPDWLTNPATQIKWGLSYIFSRYGSPLAAWAHEKALGWYGHGGLFRAGQLIGVGDRGRELVSFDRPGRVWSPEESASLMSGGNRGAALYVGEVHVNHVPGFSTVSDIENGLTMAARQVRLARS